MAKPIAVVAADTHIEELIWTGRPQITGDAFFGFEQCCSLAIKHNLPLIIAGDFLENMPANHPTSTTIRFVREQLDRLASNDLDFYFINGQHDVSASSRNNWCDAIGYGQCYVDGQVIEVGGRKLACVSHRDARDLTTVLQDIEGQKPDVLICHQVWKELKGGHGIEAHMVNHPFQVIISGDLHQRMEAEFETSNGRPGKAYSPGATHKRKINEPSTHSVLLLKDNLTCEFVPLRSRVVVLAEVFTEDDFLMLIETAKPAVEKARQSAADKKLPPSLRTPFFYLADHSGRPGTEARFESLLGTNAHVFYKRVIDKTEDPEVLQQYAILSAEEALEHAIELEAADDSVLLGDLSWLCKADNPKHALAQLREQAMKP